MRALPAFLCVDVMNIEAAVVRYGQHLAAIFKPQA